ncbi:MAG: hypothetical protein JXB00_16145 [Bacteroidales bacterium]|nr:hypothetical protein [Bacteroidales bacterium]
MKNILKKSGKTLILLTLLLTVVFNGCEKDKEDKLQLPPESAFTIDLSPFASQAKTTAVAETGTHNNFLYAATVVTFWNIAIAGVMAIPTAAYVKAFEYEPVRVSNDKWKWSYSVTVNSIVYTAELYGEVVDAGVEWEMYVSQQVGFQDFLMFDGWCNIQRTEGYWKLYESPLAPVEFLQIDWTYNWEQQTGSVKYTYTKEGTDDIGNYIEYGVTENSAYNVYYNLYSQPEEKLFNINYNSDTREGRIEYDGNSYCWDSNLYDIDCVE